MKTIRPIIAASFMGLALAGCSTTSGTTTGINLGSLENLLVTTCGYVANDNIVLAFLNANPTLVGINAAAQALCAIVKPASASKAARLRAPLVNGAIVVNGSQCVLSPANLCGGKFVR